MPKSIIYLLLNEAMERYSLYGMRSVLLFFLTTFAAFSQQKSLETFHLFICCSYLFSIAGGIVGDMFQKNKYWLIIFFTFIYTFGHLILGFYTNPTGLYAALGIIAICAGIIKPLIVSFVGDQFDLPKQQNQYGIAMQMFFFIVNLGSIMAMFISPYIIKNYGPRVCFSILTAVLLMSLLSFILGKKQYTRPVEPIRNAYEKINFTKLFLIISIFIFIAAFFNIFDQMFSVVVVQAESMNRNIFGYEIIPSQITLVNPLLILVLSPIFTIIYKKLSAKGYNIKISYRILTGMLFAIATFVLLTFVQYKINNGVRLHIFWQLIAFLLVTIAEILIMPSSAEFSYSAAPLWAKSRSISFFFFAIFLGNFVSILLISKSMNPLNIFINSVFIALIAQIGLAITFKAYNIKYGLSK